jgi:hypothetical protein
MLQRPKSGMVAVAAAAGTVCALAAAGAALAVPTPPWSQHNPAIPGAYTNATPGLASIALTNRNVPGTFVVWKGQLNSRIQYKFKIDGGGWATTETIPGAQTNTTPAAGFYTNPKGYDSELVVWKQLNGSKIFYSTGEAFSNGTISWTKPALLPGGKYTATNRAPAVIFPLNATHGRVIIAWRGPHDHVRYEIGTPGGTNGRGFTFGSKPQSFMISAGTTADPTTTADGPALTEIVSGSTGTVYVFWKGDKNTAPIDYASTPDNAGTGLQGNAQIPWTLLGSVPAGTSTLAMTTAAPAVASANRHGLGPLLLAYKGPAGLNIRYQTLSGGGWSEPYAFVNGNNNTTTDGPALLNGLLANVSPTSSGRIYLHRYNG